MGRFGSLSKGKLMILALVFVPLSLLCYQSYSARSKRLSDGSGLNLLNSRRKDAARKDHIAGRARSMVLNQQRERLKASSIQDSLNRAPHLLGGAVKNNNAAEKSSEAKKPDESMMPNDQKDGHRQQGGPKFREEELGDGQKLKRKTGAEPVDHMEDEDLRLRQERKENKQTDHEEQDDQEQERKQREQEKRQEEEERKQHEQEKRQEEEERKQHEQEQREEEEEQANQKRAQEEEKKRQEQERKKEELEERQREQEKRQEQQQRQQPASNGGKGKEDTVKLQFVKKMIKHAWDSYEKHAWGYNELSATGKSGSDGQGMFGNSHIGASLVDALDTLYIAGFMDEYKRGRKWVKEHLDYNKVVGSTVSMFEMNIRFVGACLSMYALTGDELYKEKAKDLVDRFMPAFRSSGLAHNWIVLNGYSKARDDSGPCFVIAEPGTLHLEFAYLSTITGDNRYLKQVEKVRDALTSSSMSGSLPGLISSEINTDSGTPCKSELSLDGGSDSYYEYLIKSYLQSGKTDARALRLFNDLVKSVDSKMMGKVTKGGKTYRFLGRTSGGGGYLDARMGHLACFSGGMFALGAKHGSQPDMTLQLGKDITEACHEMYDKTATKIGPDEGMFMNGDAGQNRIFSLSSPVYLLRPEVVESYFVLWRTTKDPKYRQWAWEAAQAIEKYCRVDGGYTDLANVDQVPPHPNSGMQQSFFLAETLKYLYLIFTDDDVLPLDKWVFNTEAHPFPIKGAFDSDSNLPLHSKTA
eukprot:scpid73546/ scgid33854/ Mannosyl-oligosaccharide 1,2-alpha-mannosidase IB; Mannosidase alpha class 1A member 2; Processing alpha-1,2-mannosidase IB